MLCRRVLTCLCCACTFHPTTGGVPVCCVAELQAKDKDAQPQALTAEQLAKDIGDPALVDHLTALTDVVSKKPEEHLTSKQIAALELLASTSGVAAERSVLLKVKSTRLQMEALEMLEKGRIKPSRRDFAPRVSSAEDDAAAADLDDDDDEVTDAADVQRAEDDAAAPEPVRVDKSLANVKARLDAMLTSLETDLERVDIKIGDKLHLLDKDNDGLLSKVELEEAIKTNLSQHNTDHEAQAIARILTHGQGSVTLADIQNIAATVAAKEAEERLRDVDEPSKTTKTSKSSGSTKSTTASS